MSTAASPQFEDIVHLAMGAVGGGICVWEFSSTKGLTSRFSDSDAHIGCVRTCKFTSAGHLATSGDDGVIQVVSVPKKRRLAVLEAHEDQINDLTIVEEESGFVHILSAANDASIGVWGRLSGRWTCKRRFRRHRGPVLSIAAHPSGRLALSIGTDGTLRTWNLLRGRLAFVTRLNVRPERAVAVHWSPDGLRYAVEFPHRVDCYRVDAATKPSCSFTMTMGVSALAFISPTLLVVASGKRLAFKDVSEETEVEVASFQVCDVEQSSQRMKVRALKWDEHESLLFVLTRHSEGSGLIVYRLPSKLVTPASSESSGSAAILICRAEIPFRVTCFDACRFCVRTNTAVEPPGDQTFCAVEKKQKRKEKNVLSVKKQKRLSSDSGDVRSAKKSRVV